MNSLSNPIKRDEYEYSYIYVTYGTVTAEDDEEAERIAGELAGEAAQEGIGLFVLPADADPPEDAVNELLGTAWRSAEQIAQQLRAEHPPRLPTPEVRAERLKRWQEERKLTGWADDTSPVDAAEQ